MLKLHTRINLYRNYSTKLVCQVGTKVSIIRKISKEDVEQFTNLSGDTNPVHLCDIPEKAVVHGAFLNALVSSIIGTKLPGPGTLVVNQTLNFPNKCYVGEIVKVSVELLELRKIIKVSFKCEVESKSKLVLYGDAKLMMEK